MSYFVNVFARLYIYVRGVVNFCVCLPVYVFVCVLEYAYVFFCFFFVYDVLVGVCAHLHARI